MKILHFGDIHVWHIRPFSGDFWYPKRPLGGINLLLKRRHHFPPEYPEIVAKQIAATDADAVVFSGDITTMALKSEFVEGARLFEPIHRKWGDRFFCIPGNHDRYTPGSVRARYYEQFFSYGAFVSGNLVRSYPLADDLVIVGFDCSHPCMVRSNGTLTDALAEELRLELEHQREQGNQVILTGHYPLVYPPEVPASWEHKLLKADKLAYLVGEYQPLLYLHGHKHQRWALRQGNTLCVNCGASGMTSEDPSKQAGFVVIELESDSYTPLAIEAHVLQAGTQEFAVSEVAMEDVVLNPDAPPNGRTGTPAC